MQEERLCQPSAIYAIYANRLLFRGALQNQRVEILNPPGEFGPSAQNFIEFLYFFVQRGGAFEVQLLAGALALFLYCGPERAAASFEELDQPLNFDVVLLFCAAREARGEAHFHFRVEAAGKRGIAADFDLAAPHFEQIEDAFSECLRGAARCEGSIIRAAHGHAGFIDENAARYIPARIAVAQLDL